MSEVIELAYTKTATTATPALIIYLLDMSWSMSVNSAPSARSTLSATP